MKNKLQPSTSYSQDKATLKLNAAAAFEYCAALKRIRDSKSYLEEYANFEEFLTIECGIGKSRAYQLIEVATEVETLTVLPSNIHAVEKVIKSKLQKKMTEKPNESSNSLSSDSGHLPPPKTLPGYIPVPPPQPSDPQPIIPIQKDTPISESEAHLNDILEFETAITQTFSTWQPAYSGQMTSTTALRIVLQLSKSILRRTP